jgi:hypothetical protein
VAGMLGYSLRYTVTSAPRSALFDYNLPIENTTISPPYGRQIYAMAKGGGKGRMQSPTGPKKNRQAWQSRASQRSRLTEQHRLSATSRSQTLILRGRRPLVSTTIWLKGAAVSNSPIDQ